MLGLLVRTANTRLGSKRDKEESQILNHPFFKDFPWEKFEKHELEPPTIITPKVFTIYRLLLFY